MPPEAVLALNEGARFSHRVLAVFPRHSNPTNSDKDAEPRFGPPHQFFFDASYNPSSSVLFRFSLYISRDIPLYLQILPDRITSLDRTCHDDARCLPEFNTIHHELSGARRLLCLTFRLCQAGDLIVPKGFEIDHTDTEATYHFDSIKSLASSLDFSVYMRLHDLTKAKFAIFQKAISQPVSDEQVAALKWRAHPSRLYNGKGGVVVTLGEDADSSQGSCAPTVAYESPPGYRVQPGETEFPALPTYQQANENVAPPAQVPGKRRRSGSESDELEAPKRPGSLLLSPEGLVAGSCGTLGTLDNDSRLLTLEPSNVNFEYILRALMTKNEQLEIRLARQQLDIQDLMERNKQLEAQVSQNQSEMRSLLGAVKKLQDEDNHVICFDQLAERQDELERRQEEYEDDQAKLERRQETTEEAIEAIDVRVTELDGVLEEDWKIQLCDEIRSEAVAGIRECLRHI